MGPANRRLMWHGMLLFLLGLVTGLIERRFTNMRMGVSAHLEGVMNGIFWLLCGQSGTGQPFTAGQDGSILDPALRDLRELGVHHARRHAWHGRRESNLGSRPSRATLARKSGRGRIPERGRFDYRLLRACAVGSSGQDLAMNNACWVEQIDIQIGAPR